MNKKNVILGLIVSILTLIVIISYFKFSSASPSQSDAQKTISPPALQLSLSSIIPLEDVSTQYSPTQQITIAFNDIVAPDQLMLRISPASKVIVRPKFSDPRILFVYPESSWAKGITTISILEETKSENGSFLNKETTYKINTGLPDYSNFAE